MQPSRLQLPGFRSPRRDPALAEAGGVGELRGPALPRAPLLRRFFPRGAGRAHLGRTSCSSGGLEGRKSGNLPAYSFSLLILSKSLKFSENMLEIHAEYKSFKQLSEIFRKSGKIPTKQVQILM